MPQGLLSRNYGFVGKVNARRILFLLPLLPTLLLGVGGQYFLEPIHSPLSAALLEKKGSFSLHYDITLKAEILKDLLVCVDFSKER